MEERLAQALTDLDKSGWFERHVLWDDENMVGQAELAAALLAAPSLRGLRELVEAAEKWREESSTPAGDPLWKLDARLLNAVDVFRGAISPEAPKP